MSDNGTTPKFALPTGAKFTGTTIAKVIGWKSVTSKFGDAQLEFEFLSERGNRFSLWCTVTSERHVRTFLDAGILTMIGETEFSITPIASQPRLKVTLKEGKLIAFQNA